MYQLREITMEDLVTINKWRSDKALVSQLGAPFRFINKDVDNLWYKNYMVHRDTMVRCAIIDDECPDLILGLISLTNIDGLNQSGTLSIMIGDSDHRGKGMGSFAITELINHGFNNLNLMRIELSVVATNESAIRLYERLGFVHEGVRRKAVYKNGAFIDVNIMSVLRSY